MALLESIEIVDVHANALRLPVQWVNRLSPDFRGYCGRITAGKVRPGDRIRVQPSGVDSHVKAIISMNGSLNEAECGQSVTLTLAEPVDISRGDVITAFHSPVEIAEQFQARIIWMSDHPLVAGRVYEAKIHHRRIGISILGIKYRVDVDSGAHLAAKSVARNEIAIISVGFERPIPFEPYSAGHAMGSFILVDPLSKETAGAGMIEFALRRSSNVQWQAVDVNRAAREEQNMQHARCFWFTGLSASGKSTIANLVEKRLYASGKRTYLLDGDNLRHGLNRDLGFTEADRVENMRRVAEVARLMVDAGLIVLVSLISPYRVDRAFARSLFAEGDFVEVFIDTPLETCEQRDPKGLYSKARSGLIKNFTGIDSPYEPPETAEIHVRTTECTRDEAVEQIYSSAIRNGDKRN